MGDEGLAIRDVDFEAIASIEPPTLRLRGNADASIVARLRVLIDKLHHQLVAGRAREVAVDIRALEFMNATCFNVLINWLALINDLGPDDRYHLRFAISSGTHWQRRTLHTLSCFATDLVVVHLDGE
ncbi:MAG TPA: hypothetical protein VIV11_16095 [Kofleriaceae bacterium]